MSYRYVILIILMLAAKGKVFGQFVDIRVELSSYNEVKIAGESSSDLKNGLLLQWLGISVQENIALSVGVKYHELYGNEKRLEIRILNDNSDDFSAATPIYGSYVSIPVCSKSIPIDNKNNPVGKFTAWIGFPARQLSELEVEYN
jgi:hypothetical protein